MKARNPSWPGLDDHVDRALFAEGRRALIDGDDERGLRLLRELLARRRDYPGLLELIVESYGKRIERALLVVRFGQSLAASLHLSRKRTSRGFYGVARATISR